MKIVQCWDDGIVADIKLIEILRRYDAKATFNLNARLHEGDRGNGWTFKETEVLRLAKGELCSIYEGFTIANHSFSHPHLEQLPLDEAKSEIIDNRKILQDIFGQPIKGFAYPFGSYDESVIEIIKSAGHSYARTVKNITPSFPPKDPFEFHPSCHFLSKDFWSIYDASKESGVFYFWGHSYEMINQEMWTDFEGNIKKMNDDSDSEWADLEKLF